LDCSFVSFSPQQTLGGIFFKLNRRGGGKVESVVCFPSAASFLFAQDVAHADEGYIALRRINVPELILVGRQQVIALGRLGWSLRRIEQATGVRRETGSAYLKAAGIAVRAPGAWGRQVPAKAANEVTPGSQPGRAAQNCNINPENLPNKRKSNRQDSKPAIQVTTGFGVGLSGTKSENPKLTPSAYEPFREFIELGLSRGRNAMAIWQGPPG
jgi:hypothetical protein